MSAPLRVAVIDQDAPLDTIRAYLPGNYQAAQTPDGGVILYGHDDAGWTLDGYVIPRLASGLWFATELRAADR